MILIENVSKSFHTLVAIDQISLTIRQGEVLGVLGPNGAGKTTLFKLIAGFLNADTGNIRTGWSNWPRIGYKPERLLFPNHMTVRQYLTLAATLSKATLAAPPEVVIERSLNGLNLWGSANKRIRDCSKGMRQRLAFAQALIGNPDLLLLDEPSNGLDPEGQTEICELIQGQHRSGKTIVLASHQLAEITQVCTHLIILNHGRILYQNSMEQALAERSHTTIWVGKSLEPIRPMICQLHSDITIDDGRVVLGAEAIPLRRQVLSILLAAGYDILRVERSQRELGAIYAEAVR